MDATNVNTAVEAPATTGAPTAPPPAATNAPVATNPPTAAESLSPPNGPPRLSVPLLYLGCLASFGLLLPVWVYLTSRRLERGEPRSKHIGWALGSALPGVG